LAPRTPEYGSAFESFLFQEIKRSATTTG